MDPSVAIKVCQKILPGQMASVDKSYLDKCHLLKMVPGTYLESVVEIGSVTAKIFLIYGQM